LNRGVDAKEDVFYDWFAEGPGANSQGCCFLDARVDCDRTRSAVCISRSSMISSSRPLQRWSLCRRRRSTSPIASAWKDWR